MICELSQRVEGRLRLIVAVLQGDSAIFWLFDIHCNDGRLGILVTYLVELPFSKTTQLASDNVTVQYAIPCLSVLLKPRV